MSTRFVHETDVPYGSGDGIPLLLDILRPETETESPRPAIVYIHGGGWLAGHRSYGYIPNLLLAKEGFFTVTISYRLSDVAPYPAQIHDVKAAIRFLRANATRFNIDPDRIGAWGHSAGGHLAALAGISADIPELEGESGSPGYSSRVQAVVPISPPTDFTVPWHHPDGTVLVESDLEAVTQLLDGLPGVNPTLTRLASPTALVGPGDPPSLILHGTGDDIVSFEQAEMLLAANHRAGNESTLVTMTGVDHGAERHLYPEHPDPYGTKRAVIDFFRQYLGPLPKP